MTPFTNAARSGLAGWPLPMIVARSRPAPKAEARSRAILLGSLEYAPRAQPRVSMIRRFAC